MAMRVEQAELAAAIRALAPGGIIAAYDREALEDEGWRSIKLECLQGQPGGDDRLWRLLDADGDALDEADCPASGFEESQLLTEVGLEYYKPAPAPEPVDVDHQLPAEVDRLRVRLKDENVTGTVRTREGSKDTVLPATKVMLIFDGRAGAHELLKPDELAARVEVLKADEDTTPVSLRPCALLRHGSSIVEGMLLGQVQMEFEAPPNYSHLELYAGAHLAKRDAAMTTGDEVFAHHAATQSTKESQLFYLAFFVKGMDKSQARSNALIYLPDDNKFVQVGLAHVMQKREQAPMLWEAARGRRALQRDDHWRCLMACRSEATFQTVP